MRRGRAFASRVFAAIALLAGCGPGESWRILEVDGKATEDAEGWVTFDYRVEIANDGDRPIQLGGEIVFLNASGTEIQDERLDPFVVPPGDVHSARGSASLSPEIARRLAKVDARLETY